MTALTSTERRFSAVNAGVASMATSIADIVPRRSGRQRPERFDGECTAFRSLSRVKRSRRHYGEDLDSRVGPTPFKMNDSEKQARRRYHRESGSIGTRMGREERRMQFWREERSQEPKSEIGSFYESPGVKPRLLVFLSQQFRPLARRTPIASSPHLVRFSWREALNQRASILTTAQAVLLLTEHEARNSLPFSCEICSPSRLHHRVALTLAG